MKYYKIRNKHYNNYYIYRVSPNGTMYYKENNGKWKKHLNVRWNDIKNSYEWNDYKELTKQETFIELL